MSDELPANGPAWRQPRSRGLDPDLRRMLLAAAGAGGVLVLGAGAWSLLGHRHHGVPVIAAPSGPVRVRPDNPGGMTVGVLPGPVDGDGGGEGTLAPPPEAPDPQRLREQVQAGQAPPSPATPPVAPLAVPAAPSGTVPPPGAAAPTGSAPSARPVPPGSLARVAQGAPRPPAPADAAPASRPQALPDAAPAAARPVPPAARPAPDAAPPARAAASGGIQVQLAAMDAAPAADAEWDRLRRRMPELLDGRHPEVMRVERDGRTLYRLRLGGFPDTAAAIGFCARVRAKGGACSLADF